MRSWHLLERTVTGLTIMIHPVQPALNKLLVVGGNGFIGLPFLRPRVPE